MGNFPIYLLFFCMPLWHVVLVGHINLLEVAIIFNMLVFPFRKTNQGLHFKTMDILVLMLGFSNLISVLVGVDSFYESARAYRYLTLGPILVYFIVRFSSIEYSILRLAIQYMAFSAAIQAMLAIRFYALYRIRPVGEIWMADPFSAWVASIVTLSLWCFLSICGVWFFRLDANKQWRKVKLLIFEIPLFLGLLVAATRMVTVMLVSLFPLSGYIWSSQGRTKLFAGGILSLVAGLVVIIVLNVATISKADIENDIDVKRSVGRVLNIELYKQDVQARLVFWGALVKKGMEKPILGHGLAARTIGKTQGVGFYISSAHNALVSAFYTSGLVGVVVLCSIFIHAYFLLIRAPRTGFEQEAIGKYVLLGLTVLLLVSLTNDLSAGRGNIFMFLLALVVRLYDKARSVSVETVCNKNDIYLRKKNALLSRKQRDSVVNS